MTDSFTDFVVSTEWLHAHLHDANLRIVDIRGHVLPASEPPPHYFNHYDDYVQSHIPGAVFIDWVREITDPGDPRHAQIAKPARYAEAMTRAGIGAETLVVAYDDNRGMFAARLWWSLNYYGHTRVAILDGGWPKWIAEGRPVTADVPQIIPGTLPPFVPQVNPAIHRSAEQVLAAIGTPTVLLDARSPEEFAGLYARAPRRGHIPGAVNLPRSELSEADGTIKSPEALRAKFAEKGIDGDTPEVITYCNGGVSAAFELLALRRAGLNGAMYDGSWKEWGSDETKPIE